MKTPVKMDGIKTRIKSYVSNIDSSISSGDKLDFVVDDVVDRALTYMNRDALVEEYEEDVDLYDSDDDFWETYEMPIPQRVERTLAQAVVRSFNDLSEEGDYSGKTVKSVDDHGQKVTFTQEAVEHHKNGDSDIFRGLRATLDRFKLAKIIKTTR